MVAIGDVRRNEINVGGSLVLGLRLHRRVKRLGHWRRDNRRGLDRCRRGLRTRGANRERKQRRTCDGNERSFLAQQTDHPAHPDQTFKKSGSMSVETKKNTTSESNAGPSDSPSDLMPRNAQTPRSRSVVQHLNPTLP